MLILENAITSRNAREAKEWLLKKIPIRNNYGSYFLNDRLLVIYKFANQELIAFLILKNPKNVCFWEVTYIWVDKEFRSKKIAEKLYSIAIKDKNLILSSGKSQTKFARAFWRKLISKCKFNIYAFDLKSGVAEDVVVLDDEIYTPLPYLYVEDERLARKYDVRLIAIKVGK